MSDSRNMDTDDEQPSPLPAAEDSEQNETLLPTHLGIGKDYLAIVYLYTSL